MGGLSWWHWLIVLSAFVLLFGAKKLPEAARGVGRSLRILKSEVGAMNTDERTDETQPDTNGEAIAAPAAVPAPIVTNPVPAVAPPVTQQATESLAQSVNARSNVG